MKTQQEKDNDALRKFDLIKAITHKNPNYYDLNSKADTSKIIDKVWKQLDRLSIDVLEYLNNCKG